MQNMLCIWYIMRYILRYIFVLCQNNIGGHLSYDCIMQHRAIWFAHALMSLQLLFTVN